MWFDVDKTQRVSNFMQSYSINFIVILPLILFSFTSTLSTPNLLSYLNVDYYNLLTIDVQEEIESLGLGIIVYTTFLFLLNTYILLLTCCIAVILLINAKKIKYDPDTLLQ